MVDMVETGIFGTCHTAAGPEKKKEGVLNSGPGPDTEWTRRLRLGTGRVWSPTQASGEASSLGSLPSSPLQLTSQPHRSVIHDESKAGLPPSSQKLPSTKSLGDPPIPATSGFLAHLITQAIGESSLTTLRQARLEITFLL